MTRHHTQQKSVYTWSETSRLQITSSSSIFLGLAICNSVINSITLTFSVQPTASAMQALRFSNSAPNMNLLRPAIQNVLSTNWFQYHSDRPALSNMNFQLAPVRKLLTYLFGHPWIIACIKMHNHAFSTPIDRSISACFLSVTSAEYRTHQQKACQWLK